MISFIYSSEYKLQVQKSPEKQMKVHKPSYNAMNKVYTCELSDGFRLSVQKESGDATVAAPTITDTLLDSLTETIIDSTKGWFSKPLTKEWLRPRIVIDVSSKDEVAQDFEGIVEFVAKKLVLSKDEFRFYCTIHTLVPAEKVVIAFDEPEEVAEPAIPEADNQEEALGIGPTRRILQKARVMKERTRAAKALFKAERLTQEYIQFYNADETDWEDEDEDETAGDE